MKHSRLAFMWRQALAGLALWLAGPAVVDGGPMNPIERYAREIRALAALQWDWGKTALGLLVADFP